MHEHMSNDQRQYRRLYALCFAVFLIVALVSRLLPRRLRPLAGRGAPRRSIVAEASAAANAAVPFAFMG